MHQVEHHQSNILYFSVEGTLLMETFPWKSTDAKTQASLADQATE